MFNRIASAVERVIDLALIVLISVMVVSICYQVVGRYLLNHAPGWTEEIARFLMAWITMLGSAMVMRTDGHVAVTIAADILPDPLRHAVGWLRDALILTMAGALGYYGYLFALIGDRRDSAAMEISMYWPHLSIPVGAALIALLLLLRRLDQVATGRKEP
ncbi:TRAP transporter small permease [Acuticoccus kandeliae]|uniref:TRAP transporter small permease n=1 Tax=Acuticoccus kandeliae TaxID=2073160 RepID=UPI000D3E49D2|nr:TRAP transporter small permease [Acuticoccus kandeliae]